MKTKVLPVILSLVMAITMGLKSKLDVSAVNVEGSMVDEQGVAFTLYDDGTATVLGPIDRPAYGTKFVIPAEINGYRVTEIADKAFDIGRLDSKVYSYSLDDFDYPNTNNKAMYSVTVEFQSPNYIEIIGERAFCGCDIPAGEIILDYLEKLEDGAFYGCNFANGRARDIYEYYDPNAYDDFEFNSVTIDISKSSLTTLGCETFTCCRGLREVRLPENLSNLNNAFNCCYDLEVFKIPASVTKLNNDEFYWCRRAKLNELPPELTEIGTSAFQCCENLGFKKIPDSVVKIKSMAFANTRFKDGELTLSSGLKNIETRMFEYSELEKLNIPDTVEVLGFCMAANSKIKCINSSIDGEINLPSSVETIKSLAFIDCENIESVNIRNGVRSIYTGAFAGCPNLRTVNDLKNSGIANIPEGVEIIGRREGYSAFGGLFFRCPGIKVVNLPRSLKRIEEEAFLNCNLEAINAPMGSKVLNLPENLEYIGYRAFEGCKFEEVNISPSVNEIRGSAFADCPLKNIIISPNSCLERYYSEEIANVYIHCGDDKAEEKRLTDLLTRAVQPSKLNIINHPYESGRCLATDNNCGEF